MWLMIKFICNVNDSYCYSSTPFFTSFSLCNRKLTTWKPEEELKFFSSVITYKDNESQYCRNFKLYINIKKKKYKVSICQCYIFEPIPTKFLYRVFWYLQGMFFGTVYSVFHLNWWKRKDLKEKHMIYSKKKENCKLIVLSILNKLNTWKELK